MPLKLGQLFKLRPPHTSTTLTVIVDLCIISKISVLGWILMPICLNQSSCEGGSGDETSSYVTIVTVASLVKLLPSNVFPIEA